MPTTNSQSIQETNIPDRPAQRRVRGGTTIRMNIITDRTTMNLSQPDLAEAGSDMIIHISKP
jgi:hypothetical protein